MSRIEVGRRHAGSAAESWNDTPSDQCETSNKYSSYSVVREETLEISSVLFRFSKHYTYHHP